MADHFLLPRLLLLLYLHLLPETLLGGGEGGGQNTFRTLLLDARAILILKNNILMVTENHSPFIN